MASYLDKVQVNTAITDNTKLDLGHQQITTADFFQTGVATIMELVPGSKLDVKMESFARLNPLVVPTMGRARMNNRAFFVPFRTLFRGWNDFLVDTVHIGSDAITYNGGNLINSVPYVDGADLCSAFLNYTGTDVNDNTGMVYRPAGGVSDPFDFVTSGTAYAYTVKGRQCVKILEQLGYKLDWNLKGQQRYFSAMPLLALGRIFADWYMPSQYANLPSYDFILSLCNYDVTVGPLVLSAQMVQSILVFTSYVMYDSDLFTAAWDTPNQPNAGNLSTDFKLVNLDSVSSVYSSALQTADANGIRGYVSNNDAAASANNRISGDAPFISTYTGFTTAGGGSSYTPTPISEYLLHSLHSLTDYMKRNQLAGAKVFDRYLARFGKALPAEKLDRSIYLGCATQDIQIGDVMSTADTTGSQLGSFAGKGMSYGNGHFSVDTDEFGYFIVVSSIVPVTGYFQGVDPLVMRQSKTEFWQPEFDNLGVEPIKAANLFIDSAGPTITGDPYEQIFGFVPRYATYKSATCMDRLTGNFRLPSINGGPFDNASGAWHLMRQFDGNSFSQNYVNCVHNPAFIAGETYDNQYKRIFYNDDPDAPDNFTIIHNFEVAEYAPMKPLYDTYEFEDKGKKVTLDVNGVKMN